eukprot:TRINITY_DN1496_c0_g1_i1.p2 TRINITY_DN1496_c0_g1~~TRINITY_DN1496_c0_g1_i1.p2  ORF type:complete len:333 (+),score=41.50 TRINITY_DN1496_c0_g1_i1:124-999(+)
MEFPFNCDRILGSDKEGYSILDSASVQKLAKSKPTVQIIDTLGALSAKAQGLKAIITTTSKILGTDNKVYIKTDGTKAVGFLKVGKKKLFIRNSVGKIFEISPLCVLDFYVHESVQRCGYGKVFVECDKKQQIFEKMLEVEKAHPVKLAYDRPSPKLLGFLKKHYGLVDYVPQNNNFVVYNQYFAPAPPLKSPSAPEEDKKPIQISEDKGPAIVSKDLYEKLKAETKGKENKEIEEAKFLKPKEGPSVEKEVKAFFEHKKPAYIIPPYAVSTKPVNTTSSVYGNFYSSSVK